MDGSAHKELAFVGLQRTGTNYVRQVLKEALPNVPIRSDFWKHSLPDEVDAHSLGGNVIIVSRHPVLWLQSCLVNSAKDIRESRPECFAEGVDQVEGYARVFNRFYGSWLRHKRDFGAYLLRYEDVLEGDPKKLSSAFRGKFELGVYSPVIAKLPQSVELSADDVQAVLNRECSLSPDVAKIFWDRIDPAVSRDLSYTIEEILFSDWSRTGRSFARLRTNWSKNPRRSAMKNSHCCCAWAGRVFKTTGLSSGGSAPD